jgi:hypothetical protein
MRFSLYLEVGNTVDKDPAGQAKHRNRIEQLFEPVFGIWIAKYATASDATNCNTICVHG